MPFAIEQLCAAKDILEIVTNDLVGVLPQRLGKEHARIAIRSVSTHFNMTVRNFAAQSRISRVPEKTNSVAL
jgi:hypothetical protein